MKIGMTPETGDYIFWIWLSECFGAGSTLYPALLEHFGSPYEVYKADEEELLAAVPSLTARERASLCVKNLDKAYEILGYCQRNGYHLLCYTDPRYPLSYRSLTDPPLLLYYKGTLPDFQTRLFIAMVGTRKMSEYGRKTAYKIAYELANAGAVVVSGMALGVDSVASCAALAAGGQTVAILGSGIDVAYPSEHAGFKKILEQRALVMSEFAPGSEPKGKNFPIRNRLISGLCQGTLVVEAGEGSGALITAERALRQGRDLFAVPANVGEENAAGTNRLIRDGARVALCADDILSQYSLLYRNALSAASSASLGEKSDYDASMLARMGVFSRTAGYHRVPAGAPLAPDAPAAARADERPAPAKQAEPPRVACTKPETAVKRPEAHKPCPADHSAEILAAMGEREQKVFEAIPMDHPVAIDRLQGLGYTTGQLLAALSLLEIKGLIQTLPGGLYSRA